MTCCAQALRMTWGLVMTCHDLATWRLVMGLVCSFFFSWRFWSASISDTILGSKAYGAIGMTSKSVIEWWEIGSTGLQYIVAELRRCKIKCEETWRNRPSYECTHCHLIPWHSMTLWSWGSCRQVELLHPYDAVLLDLSGASHSEAAHRDPVKGKAWKNYWKNCFKSDENRMESKTGSCDLVWPSCGILALPYCLAAWPPFLSRLADVARLPSPFLAASTAPWLCEDLWKSTESYRGITRVKHGSNMVTGCQRNIGQPPIPTRCSHSVAFPLPTPVRSSAFLDLLGST